MGPAGGIPGDKYATESFFCQRDGRENRSTARGHGEDKPVLNTVIRQGRQEIKKPWRIPTMHGRTESSSCNLSPATRPHPPHYQSAHEGQSHIYTNVFYILASIRHLPLHPQETSARPVILSVHVDMDLPSQSPFLCVLWHPHYNCSTDLTVDMTPSN